MNTAVFIYCFVVIFGLTFALSAAMGFSAGFGLREVLPVACRHAVITCLVALAVYGAVSFGVHLNEVTS